MTIRDLHMENVGFRDLIAQHKNAIALLDRAIKTNEAEIGKLMSDAECETTHDCTLCMGSCNAEE